MPISELQLTIPPYVDGPAGFVLGDRSMVSASDFGNGAATLAAELSPAREVINKCESRLNFLVGFAAAIYRGKTTLLPASRAAAAIVDLQAAYPGCDLLDDLRVTADRRADPPRPAASTTDFIAAIGHTSGSTGKPVAHAKTWSALRATTSLNAATIRAASAGIAAAKQPWIVATVPPQHMYGLETSVLLPLLAGFGIHGGRPLLPAEVASALAEVPAPRVLVSTPVHLRSLVESNAAFPEVAVVVSATAPLSRMLALDAERRFAAVLVEMFGSTETCVVGTRRTATDRTWRAYPGIRFESVGGGTRVHAPWFTREQLLLDIIESHPDGSFTVVGRHHDLVEVAGKRASLSDLTRRLLEVPGVRDAVVFQPPGDDRDRARRCAAFVVAPGYSAPEILARFRAQVDMAFVPRPLRVVPDLPRDDLGKLPLELLLNLLSKTDN